jgi:hypothetical protein
MLRKITSLTLFLSGLLLLLTSVVLFIEPEGRVAYWADWTLLGLSKPQWGDTHLTVGTLFLIAGALHIWYNWKPILAYMKNKARELTILTPASLAALALTLFVFAGTLFGLPPMAQLMDLGTHFKESAARKYGNPPYGHAELSTLRAFTGHMGLDLEAALEALRQAELDGVAPEATLKEIGRANGVPPQAVFSAMQAARGEGPTGGDALPSTPPQGAGKTPLAELCAQYGIDVDLAVDTLRAAGIEADPSRTLKEMAADAAMTPVDVYRILRTTPAPDAAGISATGISSMHGGLGQALGGGTAHDVVAILTQE